jgi:hypothetical protein
VQFLGWIAVVVGLIGENRQIAVRAQRDVGELPLGFDG